MPKINKCTCGSTDFTVTETIAHKAAVDEEGRLVVYKGDGGIDEIVCESCGKTYASDDFESIDF